MARLLTLTALCLVAAGRARAAVQIQAAEVGCPSAGQLRDRLDARLPGLLDVEGGESLTLQVRQREDGGVHVALADAAGAVALERVLRPPAAGDATTCAALADTVALIVARFLAEIGYQGPPARAPGSAPAPPATAIVVARPAPPPEETPPWWGHLGLGAAGRVGFGGSVSTPRPELAASAGVGHGRLALVLAGGVTAEETASLGGDASAFRLREYPLRLLGGARWSVGRGSLVAGGAVAASYLSYASTGVANAVAASAWELAGEAAAQYQRELWGPLVLRAGMAAGLVAAPRDFDAGLDAPVYRTPRVYLRFELGIGVGFGKIGKIGKI